MATESAEVSAPPAISGRRRHQYAAFALMVTFFVLAPFVVYPLFLMKALCFALFACAFNLLIGYAGSCRSATRRSSGRRGTLTAHAAKVWGWPPELAILCGTAAAGALGLVVGGLAIRRQGIYFAMVTLALAQMIYFFCLQAAVHRWRGRDPVGAAGHAPRPLRSAPDTMTLYFVVLAIFLGGFLLIYRDDPLAVRTGAEGHPGERAAGDLARLQGRPVQADRLRALGDLVGPGGRRPRRSSSSSPRSPTCTGRCRARWC